MENFFTTIFKFGCYVIFGLLVLFGFIRGFAIFIGIIFEGHLNFFETLLVVFFYFFVIAPSTLVLIAMFKK